MRVYTHTHTHAYIHVHPKLSDRCVPTARGELLVRATQVADSTLRYRAKCETHFGTHGRKPGEISVY